MDKNLEKLKSIHLETTIKALNQNNIQTVVVESPEELISYLQERMPAKSSVSVGGSMTLFETGVIDYLKNGDYVYYDRYDPSLDGNGVAEVFHQALSADYYLTSTNAITKDGYLYCVDGNGNRVAAMIYGPKEVIVVAGTNKIVNNIEEAKQRVCTVAAPANAIRLNKTTPCTQLGQCMDCKNPGKLCSYFVTFGYQSNPNHMTVVFVQGDYGY